MQRRTKNKTLKSQMKTSVKTLLRAIETKEKETIQKQLQKTTSVITKTASKGVIHKNTASRKVARLAKRASAAVQARA